MNRAQRDVFRKKRVLEQVARVGNVRKACRSFGVSRSAVYLWKKTYVSLFKQLPVVQSPGFCSTCINFTVPVERPLADSFLFSCSRNCVEG